MGKANSCLWAAVNRRVWHEVILKVTYNDSYHLRALEIKETGSSAGLGEPPRAVQWKRKGRERQALGSTVVQSN